MVTASRVAFFTIARKTTFLLCPYRGPAMHAAFCLSALAAYKTNTANLKYTLLDDPRTVFSIKSSHMILPLQWSSNTT